ncbi:MAG: type VI secretion system-associated FHA domain protein TagH, partial [Candidatus Competibacteraceae bacterium]|nr:type VI secretion system-associated FHA domain protein TagH [Candidatus Competibacteraceae bacterium]
MPLTLTITSYQRLSPGQEASKTIDRCDISIGRAPDNDWPLPDPERFLSSHHCRIQYREGSYYLTDTSTNGVFINHADQRVPKGQSVRLSHGDCLTMG